MDGSVKVAIERGAHMRWRNGIITPKGDDDEMIDACEREDIVHIPVEFFSELARAMAMAFAPFLKMDDDTSA